jgi:hypothetical protein
VAAVSFLIFTLRVFALLALVALSFDQGSAWPVIGGLVVFFGREAFDTFLGGVDHRAIADSDAWKFLAFAVVLLALEVAAYALVFALAWGRP